MNPLRAFGKVVAEAQEGILRESAARCEARARFLAPTRAPIRARSPLALTWAAAGAAVSVAIAAAGFIAWWPARPASLVFEVGPIGPATPGSRAEPGEPGEWIAAPADDPLPVRFSDGSTVRLASASRARVVSVTHDGARVVVERGSAHVNVVHQDHTHWELEAGPFAVHVRGTEFDVAWDPVRETFSLALEQGSVTVTGCSLPNERVVRNGETFHALCRGGRPVMDGSEEASPSRSTAQGAPPDGATVLAPQLPLETDEVSAPSPAAPSARGSSIPATRVASRAPDWRQVMDAGRHAEAIDAADSEGLPSICENADESTLMTLSDTARFAGRTNDAELILSAIRRRFPEDEQASVAAFHLGRLAFDDRRASDAARWFETYLGERPRGTLAREASGRLIEALVRSGEREGAKEAARRYLRAFPDGPHAELARSVAQP